MGSPETKIKDRIKELRRVKASELIRNEKNWRNHPKRQQEYLAGVLEEIGYADALLAYETKDGLKLIDGHLRQKLTPDQEVPVLILDVNEEEAEKLLLTLDPITQYAGAEKEKLKALIDTVIGKNEAVKALIARIAQENDIVSDEEGAREKDKIPEIPEKPKVKLGDLWILGGHRILCGDSTKKKDVECLMNGDLADMVFTDPPYGVDYVGGTKDALKIENDTKEAVYGLLSASLTLGSTFCKKGGAWYVTAPHGPAFLPFAKVLSELGIWRQTLVWAKDSIVLGHSDYNYQHEAIIYGWKPGAAHKTPVSRALSTVWRILKAGLRLSSIAPIGIVEDLSEKSGEVPKFKFREVTEEEKAIKFSESNKKAEHTNSIVRTWNLVTGEAINFIVSTGHSNTTLWQFERPKRSLEHPTMKPVELILQALINSSRKNDIISDPFLGSGSTLIAAEIMDRKCYGIELDPRCCQVSLLRWQKFTGREPVLESSGQELHSILK